jgi:peptidoglycan-associated lipoprotein
MNKHIIAITLATLLGACTTLPEQSDINKSEDILLKENNIPLIVTNEDTENSKTEILTENGFISINDLNLTDTEKNAILKDNIIHFGFNEYTLSEKSLKNIDLHIAFLKNNNTIKVIVEGHTDERGEKSYNLNLGEKRANAVKAYVQKQGIMAERIEVISFGETMPLNNSSNKKAWNKNRRAVFIYN